MKIMSWMLSAVALAAVDVHFVAQSRADLFKIDFGQLENERVPTDADGNPVLDSNGNPVGAPPALTDWNVIPTWTFADPNANVVTNSASLKGTASADGTSVTWKLTDFSVLKNTNVTLTIMDNLALNDSAGLAPALGMTANNPTKEGLDVIYDGVLVEHTVKDDYLYRNPCPAGSEMLFRFANINPGTYHVTVFMGRTTDTDGQFGKVWVDDINGKKEPTAQNTGDFGSLNLVNKEVLPAGNPKTVTVTINKGDYLWYAYMEDSSGGISGMIIDPVTSTPVAPPASSTGLFKINYGQLENERAPTDASGNPIMDSNGNPIGAPNVKDWNTIPTWTFADPNANVVAGFASLNGSASPDGTAVVWNLTDYSNAKNTNVTMTIMDNLALNDSAGVAPALGMTANNPTKEGLDVTYDGVLVPAAVKDDYLYRNPCPAGSEMLFRFANLPAGKYNVTVFMGRTSDGDGQFGKVWVDDINGKKEPTAQNTGDYGSRNLTLKAALPFGQPETVTVDIKTGDYLWYGYMEDSTGGISGMIIRGIAGGSSTGNKPTLALATAADGSITLTYTGTLYSSATANGKYAAVAGASSPFKVTPKTAGKSATFYQAAQ